MNRKDTFGIENVRSHLDCPSAPKAKQEQLTVSLYQQLQNVLGLKIVPQT